MSYLIRKKYFQKKFLIFFRSSIAQFSPSGPESAVDRLFRFSFSKGEKNPWIFSSGGQRGRVKIIALHGIGLTL
jgi:hypothetical protein